MRDGRSQWITGDAARAHVHVERACADVILVGRGTWELDRPKLDVRLAGLEGRSPLRVVLSTQKGASTSSAKLLGEACPPTDLVELVEASPPRVITFDDVPALPANTLLVEGGMATATAFLREDLVDRLLIYRAPILIGGGRTLGDIGLAGLGHAHGRWLRTDTRRLGSDTLDVYERVRG